MPTNCAECPMYQSEDSDFCDITGEWITGEEMKRHKDCPLVEIVTCKECKHYKFHGDNGYCSKRVNTDSHTDVYREPDYFCKLGERRE